jgi:hypothetical protein
VVSAEELTWRNRALYQLEHTVFKPPIALPITHGETSLEVFSKMICPFRPRVHRASAETTSGFDIRHGHHPVLHGPVLVLGIVD